MAVLRPMHHSLTAGDKGVRHRCGCRLHRRCWTSLGSGGIMPRVKLSQLTQTGIDDVTPTTMPTTCADFLTKTDSASAFEGRSRFQATTVRRAAAFSVSDARQSSNHRFIGDPCRRMFDKRVPCRRHLLQRQRRRPTDVHLTDRDQRAMAVAAHALCGRAETWRQQSQHQRRQSTDVTSATVRTETKAASFTAKCCVV